MASQHVLLTQHKSSHSTTYPKGKQIERLWCPFMQVTLKFHNPVDIKRGSSSEPLRSGAHWTNYVFLLCRPPIKFGLTPRASNPLLVQEAPEFNAHALLSYFKRRIQPLFSSRFWLSSVKCIRLDNQISRIPLLQTSDWTFQKIIFLLKTKLYIISFRICLIFFFMLPLTQHSHPFINCHTFLRCFILI